MTAQFSITQDDNFSGATILLDGEVYTVDSRQPGFDKIVQHLITNVDDDETLLGLINPAQGISNTLTRLSERVSYLNGAIFFDGDPLDNAIAKHIVRILEAENSTEKDYLSLVRFLEKVSTNPSKKSRKHLYHFVESNGMTVHEDGDLVAYKGIRTDGFSSNAGYGIVDGVVFGEIDSDGRLLKSERLPNEVGSVVEIPRSLVDDDRQHTCSTGLHVGTFGYASGFAPKLLTVKVNPRDVVSVPHDYNDAKIRVSRYFVLEENNGEYTDATLAAKDDADFTEDVPNEVFNEKTVDLDDDEKTTVASSVSTNWDVQSNVVITNSTSYNVGSTDKAKAKIAEFKDLIRNIDDSKLRRHRNKRVTAKNRALFDQAVTESGRSYPA